MNIMLRYKAPRSVSCSRVRKAHFLIEIPEIMIVYHIAPSEKPLSTTNSRVHPLTNPLQSENEDNNRFSVVRSARFRRLGRAARWAMAQNLTK